MKIGEIIICIDDNILDYKPKVKYLTIGKKYTIISLEPNKLSISVLNDNNEVIFYDTRRFITLKKWRSKQLDKLV